MTTLRELAHRNQDGLEVTLLWNARTNEVSVEVADNRNESGFAFAVGASSALDAFHHPYAYAPVLATELPETPALVA
jgi:hypothetical protein